MLCLVVRGFVKGLLVVGNLVMKGELASVSIVIVHLEDKVAILDVDLARHEEGRVVLEAPVVAGIPLLGIPCVEIISPAKIELLGALIVIINLNKVIFGVPWHLGIVEVVIPWRPARGPKVHHELRWHIQEMSVLGALSLANELVVDKPRDAIRGPFDRVGDPVSAGVEASGIVVILSAILPDNVH
jgi:hypothetical protein